MALDGSMLACDDKRVRRVPTAMNPARRRFVGASALMFVAGCAGSPDAHGTPAASETMEVPWSGDPLVGVFPPSWRVGDRWTVVMTVRDDLQEVAMASPPPRWVDNEFHFEVLSVAEADEDAYRLAVDSERLHYVATYTKQPFAFARLEDRSRGGFMIPRLPGEPIAPCVAGVVAGYITDFPAPPGMTVPEKQPVRMGGLTGWVQMAPTADGARWTYTIALSTETFTWSRGQPWWSTVERRVSPEFQPPEGDPVEYRGRLVAFTQR